MTQTLSKRRPSLNILCKKLDLNNMANRTYAKDFHKLHLNIDKLSGGQALIIDWSDDDLSTFEVEIAPTGGLYRGGKFKFKFEVCIDTYPSVVPTVICTTPIYHPNIDTIGSDYSYNNVCVSLLEEWTEDNSLEDCVQALLFLFYNPNLEDPLCPLISPDMAEDEFEENVKISLEGGYIDGFVYKTNYGYSGYKRSAGIVIHDNEPDVETEDQSMEITSEENFTEMCHLQQESVSTKNKCEPVSTLSQNDSRESKTNEAEQEETDTETRSFNIDKTEQHGNKLNMLAKFLRSVRTYRSDKYITTSNIYQEQYVFGCDYLVPYNILLSVLCSHLFSLGCK